MRVWIAALIAVVLSLPLWGLLYWLARWLWLDVS